MRLRRRLFLGFALTMAIVIPLALGMEYRQSRRIYRDHLLQQSRYVAELLEEKLIEPLDDVEEDSGTPGHWEKARLDPERDRSTAWVETGGKRLEVPLQKLLAKLREVPLTTLGYTFILDTHGTLIACLPDGRVLNKKLTESDTERIFKKGPADRRLAEIDDPVRHGLSDAVLLVVPRVGLSVGVIFPERDLDDQLAPLAWSILPLAATLLAGGFVLSYAMARRVTAPLEGLTEAVQRIAKGELDVPLPRSSISEVGQLSAAFAKMRADLADYLEQLQRTAAENARVAHELDLARAIQGNVDLEVRRGHWTLCGRSEAARDVGGDFFDIFELPDGRLALLLGDVSGKGIPAALHTLLARAGLKLGLSSTGSPSAALASANSLLALDNADSVFVSAVVAVLNVETDLLVWSRAGHPSPLSADGSLVGPNGPPLGLVEGLQYEEVSTVLAAPGWLLYSDGFPEAEDAAGEFLGSERLRQGMGTPELDVWGLLTRHRGEAEPSDDATAILLQRDP